MRPILRFDPEYLWKADIREILAVRTGNCFYRAGFKTLEDIKAHIEENGLYRTDSAFGFGGRGPEFIRNAGLKTWDEVLQALQTLGFDWTQHLDRPHTKLTDIPTVSRWAMIEAEIARLSDLLEELKDIIAQEKGSK